LLFIINDEAHLTTENMQDWILVEGNHKVCISHKADDKLQESYRIISVLKILEAEKTLKICHLAADWKD